MTYASKFELDLRLPMPSQPSIRLGGSRKSFASQLLLAALLALPLAGGLAAGASEPTSKPDSILTQEEEVRFESLLHQLNSSKFDQREEATSQLNQLDERHLAPLQKAYEAQRSPDAKARLFSVLRRKEEARFERLHREFLLSRNNEEANRALPGWETFSEASGFTDRKTKALFTKLLTTYPWLVHEKISSQQDAYDKAVRVAADISSRLDVAGEVTQEDGIALAYTIAMTGDKLDAGLEATGHRVFSRHPFSTRLTSTTRTATSESTNAIFNFYSRFAEHAKDYYRTIASCLNAQIPAGGKVAAKYLMTEKAVDQPEVFELAMSAVARFGTSEDIPAVEKWLNNKTVVLQSQRLSNSRIGFNTLEAVEVQARDLALATTIILHQESPHVVFSTYRPHPLRAFFSDSVGQIVGTSDEVRDELMESWQERLKLIPELQPAPELQPIP